MKKNLLIAWAAVLVIGLASPLAHAGLPTPGGGPIAPDAINLSGDTLVTDILNANLAPPTAGGQTLFGTYSAWVYRTAGGTLDFLYQINSTLNANSQPILQISAGTFASSVITDVGYLSGGIAPPSGNLGINPTTDDIALAGNTAVDWYYPSPLGLIQPGLNSAILVVRTNQTTFTGGALSAIDSTTSSNNAFVPGPEPSTMVLAGLGALGFVGYGMRRRKAKGA